MGEYGTTVGIDDAFFRPLSDDQAILAQALVMRLETARGTYWTDPDYGFLVSNLVNEHLTIDKLAILPVEVQTELEKDERVAAIRVTARAEGRLSSRVVKLHVHVTPLTGVPFALVLAASEVSVSVLTQGSA